MAARTGAQFLAGLRDRREIWVGGERIREVVDHPALRGAAHALAAVYDLQHQAAADCLMPDPQTGEPINVSHMIPRSRADLERRHQGLERIAEYSVGLMGRTPDYMNVTFAGFAGRADEWAAHGNERGAATLVAYQKMLARRDLSLTHTIVHSTVDAAKGGIPRIQLGGLKERSENTSGENARRAERKRAQALVEAAAARERIEILQPLSVALAPTGLPSGRTVLRIDRASVGYEADRPIISDFSLTITGPERVALTGPNGSGKTTVLALVTGQLPPWTGTLPRHCAAASGDVVPVPGSPALRGCFLDYQRHPGASAGAFQLRIVARRRH